MSFRASANSAFDKWRYSETPTFDELESTFQADLASEFMLANPELAHKLFPYTHEATMAAHFSQLLGGVGNCDVLQLAADIRTTLLNCQAFKDLIDDELERLWHDYVMDRDAA